MIRCLLIEIELLILKRSEVKNNLIIQQEMLIGRIGCWCKLRIHFKVRPWHHLSLNNTTGTITKLNITTEANPATQLPWLIQIKIRDVIEITIAEIDHATTRGRKSNLVVFN